MAITLNGTTGISGVDGSAGTPALQGIDGNTGLYFGTDEVSISTGGSQRLVVDSSGRLGLGSSNPNAGRLVITSSSDGGFGGSIVLENSNNSDTDKVGIALRPNGSATTAIGSYGESRIISEYVSGSTNGANNLQFWTHSGDGTVAQALHIDSSQRVGIGNNASGFTSNLIVGSGSSDNGATIYAGTASSSYLHFADGASGADRYRGGIAYNHSNNSFAFATNDTTAVTIDSSQRLLVGTSSAISGSNANDNLQLVNASGSILSVASSDTTISSGTRIGEVEFWGQPGSTWGNFATIGCFGDATAASGDNPGRLVFSTTADGASSPTERLRIASDGRMSVGSAISANGHRMTNPGTDTSVLRLQQTQNAAGVLSLYYTGQPNNTNDRFLSCLDNSGTTPRCFIQSNGGIANYQANNSNLSDLRTKKDISPAANTWDCLKEWEIVNFRYKDQPDDAALNLGVIAQQVAESCPEIVTVFQEEKEATETEPAQEERLGVKEQQMVWMAIKALQEAQLRIETLEAEVQALKGA